MAKKTTAMPSTIEINGVEYTLTKVNCSDESMGNGRGRVITSHTIVSKLVDDVAKGIVCRDVLIQRTDDQWNKKQKSLLILSILKNIPIGTILMTGKGMTEDKLYMKNSLIDGLQRVTTICDYVNGKFALDKHIAPLQCMFTDDDDNVIIEKIDIAGKKFDQLPVALQVIIKEYQIPTNKYDNFTAEELDDIIFCTNNGTSPKIGQRIRFTLGTKMMRYIQPICDGTFWEKTKGCKAKNDTILITVMRALAMTTKYAENKSFSTSEIMSFAEWFSDNGSVKQIEYLAELFEQLDSCTNHMNEDYFKYFDACNIPHIIMALDKFNGDNMDDNKDFGEFLENFMSSDEFDVYLSYCKKTGSGGSMYSIDNSDERQSLIDAALDEYLENTDKDEVDNINEEDYDNADTRRDDSTEELFDGEFEIPDYDIGNEGSSDICESGGDLCETKEYVYISPQIRTGA